MLLSRKPKQTRLPQKAKCCRVHVSSLPAPLMVFIVLLQKRKVSYQVWLRTLVVRLISPITFEP